MATIQQTSDQLIIDYKKSNIYKTNKAINEWPLKKFEDDFNNGRCFFATLLFVDGTKREEAIKQFNNFIKFLNKKIYGQSTKRFQSKKPIKQFPLIEGGEGTSKSVHYHCIFVNPYDRQYTDKEFMSIIIDCWIKMPLSMKMTDIAVDIKKVYELSELVKYCSKVRTKANNDNLKYQDSIDVMNICF